MGNIIKEEIALLQSCKTQAERDNIIAELKKKHQNDDFDTAMNSLKQIKECVKKARVETKLLALSEFGISLSHVSKEYLGKSRSYLSQRLHGNNVNGKPTRLTEKEIQKISEGLNTAGKKLQELSESLVS